MPEHDPTQLTTAQLLAAMQRALTLLAHTIGARVDAAPLLHSMMLNYAQDPSKNEMPGLDELVIPMLLSLSSLAVKQHPDDAELKTIYQGLRAAPRH